MANKYWKRLPPPQETAFEKGLDEGLEKLGSPQKVKKSPNIFNPKKKKGRKKMTTKTKGTTPKASLRGGIDNLIYGGLD